jgi:hypothetical protein
MDSLARAEDPELNVDMTGLGPKANCSDRVVDALIERAH